MSSSGERSTECWCEPENGFAWHPDCPTHGDKSYNNVHSKDFESKIDDYFTSKTKEKDHGTRAASIKIGGKWT
jgi:hypothetical protein